MKTAESLGNLNREKVAYGKKLLEKVIKQLDLDGKQKGESKLYAYLQRFAPKIYQMLSA